MFDGVESAVGHTQTAAVLEERERAIEPIVEAPNVDGF